MDNILADYALMSVSAYRNIRDPNNRVLPSSDWQKLLGALGHISYPSGFEAVAYRNGNDMLTRTEKYPVFWVSAR